MVLSSDNWTPGLPGLQAARGRLVSATRNRLSLILPTLQDSLRARVEDLHQLWERWRQRLENQSHRGRRRRLRWPPNCGNWKPSLAASRFTASRNAVSVTPNAFAFKASTGTFCHQAVLGRSQG